MLNWIPDIPSGVMRNNALSADVRIAAVAESKFMSFVRTEKNFGRKKGERLTIPRIRNIAEPTSAVLETNIKIPEDSFALSSTYG